MFKTCCLLRNPLYAVLGRLAAPGVVSLVSFGRLTREAVTPLLRITGHLEPDTVIHGRLETADQLEGSLPKRLLIHRLVRSLRALPHRVWLDRLAVEVPAEGARPDANKIRPRHLPSMPMSITGSASVTPTTVRLTSSDQASAWPSAPWPAGP